MGWAPRDRWLSRAHAENGHLVVYGRGVSVGDLLLGPEGAWIVSGGIGAVLAWDDYGPPPASRRGQWWISHWTVNRGGKVGVGVGVRGPYVEATDAVRRQRAQWLDPLAAAFDGTTLVAVIPSQRGGRGVAADRAMVDVLCRLLRERPDLRPRLADGERVNRLVADMWTTPLAGIEPVAGGRRPLEVRTAMRALGYEHRLDGRPLPGDPVAPIGAVAAEVLAHLRASPYTKDLDLGEADVRPVVARFYADVTPWPLQALLDEPVAASGQR